jgi:ADP-ribose pyrophosphatase YjhB (NUDIX family)
MSTNEHNYFRSTKERPFHISVGAVVVNDAHKLLCKHFTNFHGRPVNMFLFPTETLEPHESLEQALHRGLKEEVGVTADIRGYIGTSVGFAVSGDKVFEKTVLYFLLHCKTIGTPLFPFEDGVSTIEWHTPEFLLEQAHHLPEDMIHSVLNESNIIRNVQKNLQSETLKI